MSRLAALAGEPNAESAGMSRAVIGWCADDRAAGVKGDDETETGKQGRGTGRRLMFGLLHALHESNALAVKLMLPGATSWAGLAGRMFDQQRHSVAKMSRRLRHKA